MRTSNMDLRPCILLLTIYLIESASGLQCFRCTYNDLKTDTFLPDEVENLVLDHFRPASDVRCGMDQFEQDQYIVNVRNCPEPEDPLRYMYKCAEIRGTTRGHITYAGFIDVSLEYETVERDCLEVPKADPAYTDGSHGNIPGSGPARYMLEKTFEGLEIGDVEFSGSITYDSQTVSVPGLQCPQCSYSELDSEGDGIFDAILRRFANLNEPSCQLEPGSIEADSTEISLRNCPAAPQGHTNKCWSVHGTVSAEVAGTLFHYKTVDRDCTSGSSDDSSYSNGCHDTSDNPGLIVQTYQDLGLSDIHFQGQTCFSGSDWKAFAYALTGGAASTLCQPITIVISLLVFCFCISRQL